jgi:hypothetical protein
MIRIPESLQAWIDEQLAAGKTQEEIEEQLWDSPESDQQRHDERTRFEDECSMRARGY